MTDRSTFGWVSRVSGTVLVFVGLTVNPWVVGWALATGGRIESGAGRIAVAVAGLSLCAVGLWVLRTRPRISLSFANVSVLTGVTVFSFGAMEVALRIVGYRPWRPDPPDITVSPGDRYYAQHPTLGYVHLPGRFEVTLADGYTFTTTHDQHGRRITRPENSSIDESVTDLWIFGCSFTHGWTVNDEESYPYLVQAAMPQMNVTNFGITGYGTLHSLIQFREAIASGPPPSIAVVAYATFHDPRNTFLRERRKVVAPWNQMGMLQQPYAQLDGDGRLRYQIDEVTYRPFPMMRHSSLVHVGEIAYNTLERRFRDSREVTIALLREFRRVADSAGVDLVLAGITPGAAPVLQGLKGEGFEIVDMSVPNDSVYTNLPHDWHPSPLAHQRFAETLVTFLQSSRSERPVF